MGWGDQQSGTGGFTNLGGGIGGGGSLATAPGTPAPPATPALTGIDINPLDPAASAQSAESGISGFFSGLRGALFGADKADPYGQHGGLLGDVPLVSDVARFATANAQNVGGVVSSIPGHLADIVGGALEHVPAGPEAEAELSQQFAAMPDSPEKQAAQAAADKANGILGTGILSDKAHIYEAALRAYDQGTVAKAPDHPTLYGGTFEMPGSVADTITNLFGGLQAPVRTVERAISGAGKAGSGGLNELDVLRQVASGQYAFNQGGLSGNKDLSPVEATAVAMSTPGKDGGPPAWTDQEALDYLSSHGAGFSHSQLVEMAGSTFLDPVMASMSAAGAVAKIGALGAKAVDFAAGADEAVTTAQKALDGAQAAMDAGTAVAGAVPDAAKITELQAAVTTATDNADLIRAGGGGMLKAPNRINFIARALQSEHVAPGVADMLKTIGTMYKGLEGTDLGRAAKIVRTIIDPLHALDLHRPAGAQNLDLMSEAFPKALIEVRGPVADQQVRGMLQRLDPTGTVRDLYTRGIGNASANWARESVGEIHRADILLGGMAPELMADPTRTVDATLNEVIKNAKQSDVLRQFKQTAVGKGNQVFDEAAKAESARRLAQLLGGQSEEEWAKEIASWGKNPAGKLNILNDAMYGIANQQLLEAAAASVGKAGALDTRLQDLVLMARTTISKQGAGGLLNDLAQVTTEAEAKKIILDAMQQYPQLRYVGIDDANWGKTIQDFKEYLTKRMPSMPMQVTHEELGGMTQEMRDMESNLDKAYSLGFAPDQEYRWGLERTNVTGAYAPVGNVWVGHVADAGIQYQAGHALDLNIAGHPILTALAQKALRPIDYIDAMGRVMRAQVSGAMIASAAKAKFVQTSMDRFAGRGMTETSATDMWNRLHQAIEDQTGYSSPRGLGAQSAYDIVDKPGVFPVALKQAGFDRNDLMGLIMHAYNGDMRFIGLTQKFTGAAKEAMFKLTGSNLIGQISEHVWPYMKFQVNPIFMAQQKIEPWIMSVQRGIAGAGSLAMSAADKETASLLQTMMDRSFVRMGDVDQYEYGARALHGDLLGKQAVASTGQMSRINKASEILLNTQGIKRIDMLRAFRQGLGAQLKTIWETTNPGEWDKMKMASDLAAHTIQSEDDFAVKLIANKTLGSDLIVNRALKMGSLNSIDFSAAVKTGEWHIPSSLGELKGLDMETMSKALNLTGHDGTKTDTIAKLRAAIADGSVKRADVVDALKWHDASADYITRVQNALDFSWTGFWKTAAEKYNLTSAESRNLQDMFAASAKMREMTPVDYISQVFSPTIGGGMDATMGDLGKSVELLRGGKMVTENSSLAQLTSKITENGVVREATKADLVEQISRVFAAHLDPSAKRSLLLEMRPELNQAVDRGELQFGPSELSAMWDKTADNWFAKRITGYMDGVAGTGDHAVITDAARGDAKAQAASLKYQEQLNMSPLLEKRDYALDAPLAHDAAAERTADPSGGAVVDRVPTKATMAQMNTDLKTPIVPVDDRTHDAYQSFVNQNDMQFTHMTTPVRQGGGGIKVTYTAEDPYPDLAALQKDVAAGNLKVWLGDSNHPLMTNEQVVQSRAVHSYFGHAAPGHGFDMQGVQNAVAEHGKMYTDDARAINVGENYSNAAYKNFSPETAVPARPAGALPRTAAEYTNEVPAYTNGPTIVSTHNEPLPGQPTKYTKYPVSASLGPNWAAYEAAHPQEAGDTLAAMADFQRKYNVHIMSVDVHPIHASEEAGGFAQGGSVAAVTIGSHEEGRAVILFSDHYWGGTAEDTPAGMWAFSRRSNANFAEQSTGAPFPWDMNQFKTAAQGAPYSRGGSAQAVADHEGAHALTARAGEENMSAADVAKYKPYNDLIDSTFGTPTRKFAEDGAAVYTPGKPSLAAKQISQYALKNRKEGEAELFTVAYSPAYANTVFPPALTKLIKQYKQVMEDAGFVRRAEPAAGMTFAEAAASGLHVPTIRKAAIPSQDILSRFGDQFVGVGKHVESNPDVARASQMFAKWAQLAVQDGLMNGQSSRFSDILHDIGGIPTHDAVPYNETEAKLMQLASSTMNDKWRDAYRLHYFNQSRTMLERSINHPMFGLYPASFMWGKVAPELVRFIAQRPFGMKTGAGLRTLTNVQSAVAMQREYDPAFQKKLDDMGKSSAMTFGGYLLPSLPWDVQAQFPKWATDIANEGNKEVATVDAGGPASSPNLVTPMTDTAKKLIPALSQIPWAAKGVGELQTDIGLGPSKQVPVAQLPDVLQQQMQDLKDALSRG